VKEMNVKKGLMSRMVGCAGVFLLVFVLLVGTAWCDSVNVMLKNNSSVTVEVALVDQYGGNFSASVDGGMSQNHALKTDSEIKVGEAVIHVVKSDDEGKEIVIAE
jgi:hypothetical protein